MKTLAVIFMLILFVVALGVIMAPTLPPDKLKLPTAPMPWHPTPPSTEKLTPPPAAYPGPEPTVTPEAYPQGVYVVGHDMNPSHPGPHDHTDTAFTPDDAGLWAFLWDLFK